MDLNPNKICRFTKIKIMIKKRVLLPLFFVVIFSNFTSAQSKKSEFITASIGFGLSAPNDNFKARGTGFYAQGEYIFGLKSWVDIRPYVGLIFTSPSNIDNNPSLSEYKVTSNALMIGGKARILAPIPYFAPYFELGLGASVGSFQTYTAKTNIKKNGIIPHVPFSIGIAVGRNHNFDFKFTYYFQSTVEQFCGAAAIGYSFPE